MDAVDALLDRLEARSPANLSRHHEDPFDRIPVAQARVEVDDVAQHTAATEGF
jgi:PIN domain nuclease of toxin-antitoxin system